MVSLDEHRISRESETLLSRMRVSSIRDSLGLELDVEKASSEWDSLGE
jgi:hypothetical protein